MKLSLARSFQQLRLWAYLALLVVLVFFRLGSGTATLTDFIMFMVIGALFYLEVCPVCGRLCWWELSPLRKWPNVLWIGSACRKETCDETASSPAPNVESH
jgi:hypothetical protein